MNAISTPITRMLPKSASAPSPNVRRSVAPMPLSSATMPRWLCSCRLISAGAVLSMRVSSGRSSRCTLSDSTLPSLFRLSMKPAYFDIGRRKVIWASSVPSGWRWKLDAFTSTPAAAASFLICCDWLSTSEPMTDISVV